MIIELVELEKSIDNISWFTTGRSKYKVKIVGNYFLVWISINKYNIAGTMMMYDFIERFERDENVIIKTDKSWNGHFGFKIEDENKFMTVILDYIEEFIVTWNLDKKEKNISDKYDANKASNIFNDFFTDEEWYTC